MTSEIFVPIHQHLLINAIVLDTFTSEDLGNEMMAFMVDRIGMVPVTEPKSKYVTTPGNEGLTGSINLATSHIAYHVWDTTKQLMLDVYSCKPFKEQDVKDVITEYFGGFYVYHALMLDRNRLARAACCGGCK